MADCHVVPIQLAKLAKLMHRWDFTHMTKKLNN